MSAGDRGRFVVRVFTAVGLDALAIAVLSMLIIAAESLPNFFPDPCQ